MTSSQRSRRSGIHTNTTVYSRCGKQVMIPKHGPLAGNTRRQSQRLAAVTQVLSTHHDDTATTDADSTTHSDNDDGDVNMSSTEDVDRMDHHQTVPAAISTNRSSLQTIYSSISHKILRMVEYNNSDRYSSFPFLSSVSQQVFHQHICCITVPPSWDAFMSIDMPCMGYALLEALRDTILYPVSMPLKVLLTAAENDMKSNEDPSSFYHLINRDRSNQVILCRSDDEYWSAVESGSSPNMCIIRDLEPVHLLTDRMKFQLKSQLPNNINELESSEDYMWLYSHWHNNGNIFTAQEATSLWHNHIRPHLSPVDDTILTHVQQQSSSLKKASQKQQMNEMSLSVSQNDEETVCYDMPKTLPYIHFTSPLHSLNMSYWSLHPDNLLSLIPTTLIMPLTDIEGKILSQPLKMMMFFNGAHNPFYYLNQGNDAFYGHCEQSFFHFANYCIQGSQVWYVMPQCMKKENLNGLRLAMMDSIKMVDNKACVGIHKEKDIPSDILPLMDILLFSKNAMLLPKLLKKRGWTLYR